VTVDATAHPLPARVVLAGSVVTVDMTRRTTAVVGVLIARRTNSVGGGADRGDTPREVRDSLECGEQSWPMARPKRSAGRPSLGPRDDFHVRVPEAVGDIVRDLADAEGMTFNDVLAVALSDHFGVPRPYVQRRPALDELPLTA